MINLKWSDLSSDYIKRIEEKTGKERYIPLNNNTRSIINRNRGKNSEYVFALGQMTGTFNNKEWCLYKDGVISGMNSYLKTLQQALEIKTKISTHTSRHTFATHNVSE